MTYHRDECLAIARIMRTGGYFDRIMQGGAELDRVKAWLGQMAGAPCASGAALQQPDYPLFPGLRHQPFHGIDSVPGAVMLEQHAAVIASEWRALAEDDYLVYSPPKMHKQWSVYLLQHMGCNMAPVAPHCPQTHELLRQLPGWCGDYLWGDALFSVHAAGAHLAGHCSIDNFRVRAHLGIDVPPGCTIRVGTEQRAWADGRVLLFEDSFEHEVWNRSAAPRALLIVDFWHPDLTSIEIAALRAGFGHAEVRRHILFKRLSTIARGSAAQDAFLTAQIDASPLDASLQHFWAA